jgi:hypothetical protein
MKKILLMLVVFTTLTVTAQKKLDTISNVNHSFATVNDVTVVKQKLNKFRKQTVLGNTLAFTGFSVTTIIYVGTSLNQNNISGSNGANFFMVLAAITGVVGAIIKIDAIKHLKFTNNGVAYKF